MVKNTEKSNFNSVHKTWKKPTIKQLGVNKTMGGIGDKNENGGHPLGSPKTVGQGNPS